MAHGIMFHHFHSASHTARPGSISENQFDRMVGFLQKRFRILSPEDFLISLKRGSLQDNQIVLTFDDALQSQADVALPVLEARGIRGIFSVYSSVFSNKPDPLEVFAAFRADFFDDFEEFWERFFAHMGAEEPHKLKVLEENYPADYLALFPFYTSAERKFRFVRDEILGPVRYAELMWSLIQATPSFILDEVVSSLWMTKEGVQSVSHLGHSVGLHSHTHPTRMDQLPVAEQEDEYKTNKAWIESELNLTPQFVAHPCGRYSRETISVLEDLGVQAGFRSTLTSGPYGTVLEIPREDHANVIREMEAG